MKRIVVTILAVVVFAWGLVRLMELVSPLHRPWTPADLAEVGGEAMRWKLAAVADDPNWCRAVLRGSNVPFSTVPDRRTGPGCGFAGAVRLEGSEWSPRGPVMTCPLAVAAVTWERRVVRPAARKLGARLTALEHYGTYSCRPIAGTSRRSQHATANALDIAGFRFAKRPPVRVRSDWDRGTPRAAFLRQVHAGACDLFGTVLGPGYNAAHRDHFHLDMANWRYCP